MGSSADMVTRKSSPLGMGRTSNCRHETHSSSSVPASNSLHTVRSSAISLRLLNLMDGREVCV